MRHFCTSLTQGLNKIQLAATICRQILDEKHALTLGDGTLDPGIASKTLGFLAHILHRQRHALSKPGGKGDACRLTTGKCIEALMANIMHDDRCTIIHHRGPHPREGNDLAAVDIDRTHHA